MASSLLALLDDIASILDDVTLMTKVSAKNTAGVLGDDLALNAEQVSGVNADRELPVVWAVAKGSLVNKVILVPVALALSVFLPWLVIPLLMCGGAYLCYEGFEKLVHKYLHKKNDHQEHLKIIRDASIDVVAAEKAKIKGAIRTDFVLSAEIVAITLGQVADRTFVVRLSVLSLIALIMTIGVYGLVAGIVKVDDLGLYLSRKTGMQKKIGKCFLLGAPLLLKSLSVVGTVAMFLVGGGIITHGFHFLMAFIQQVEASVGGLLGHFVAPLMNTIAGVFVGLLTLVIVSLARKI